MSLSTASGPTPRAEIVPRTGSAASRHRRAYGALDLGTNNCRLLIARAGGGGFTIIDAFSRVVRLGEGLLQTGRLSDAAQERALAALMVCAEKLTKRGVWLTRNVATEACRAASNGAAFIDRVYDATGIALDVISPAEEARLAVLGCQALIEPGPTLVFDIGGGSTELILVETGAGDDPEMLGWISIPWGVVSLAETEPALLAEADRAAAFERMVACVASHVRPFAARLAPQHGPVRLLGTSGTITTLASVELGLTSYDRDKVDGCTVGSVPMRALGRMLAGRSPSERAMVPCIGRDRADLVVAGCAILEAILDGWPAEDIRVADRGIREGILRTLIGRDTGQWP